MVTAMADFLKLIRWQNLVIVIITQVLVCYAVVEPLVEIIGIRTGVTMTLQLPVYDFIILVFATVSITAGGYVINDYFDIRTDLINRGEVIVGTKISRRRALMWHNILNVAGVAAGFYVSFEIGYFWAGIIFMLVSGLLYFYSATYKRMLLIGNLVVAVLTAMVPMMVVLFEVPPLIQQYSPLINPAPSLKVIWFWGFGFAGFAFLTTLAREIVKDMQDFEGDSAYGSNSLPVVAGMSISKAVVILIQTLIIGAAFTVWTMFLSDIYTLVYIIAGIGLPLIAAMILTVTSRSQEQFGKISGLLKIVMMAGILYSVLAWLILTNRIAP